jgi:hypothetical protein
MLVPFTSQGQGYGSWSGTGFSTEMTKTAATASWLAKLREPLLKLSKCPDFVVNRGHYFGTAKFNDTDGLSDDEKAFGTEPVLSEEDKRALIEFIKTF